MPHTQPGHTAHHHHHHHHGHQHSHHSAHHRGQRMLLTVGLNLLITVAEFVGGLLSGSLALLSDAIHNLSDTLAILLSFVALRWSAKDATQQHTFGYKRYEILAALFNAVVLVAISLFLFAEAWQRFLHPQPVQAGLMLVVALVGLVANLASMLLLQGHQQHNLNVRSAYLHLLGDTLSSVAVIVGGGLIYWFGWTWFDPLVTVLIGAFIIRHAWEVIRETVQILVMRTPPHLHIDQLRAQLEAHPGVANVHHLHAWQLHDEALFVECHIDLREDLHISQADQLRAELQQILAEQCGVQHATFQLEYNCCQSKALVHSE